MSERPEIEAEGIDIYAEPSTGEEFSLTDTLRVGSYREYVQADERDYEVERAAFFQEMAADEIQAAEYA